MAGEYFGEKKFNFELSRYWLKRPNFVNLTNRGITWK